MTNYPIEMTVKSIKGNCDFGYKVGDKIVFDGKTIKGNICYSALFTVLPKIYAMGNGVKFSWADDKGAILQACPDAENPLVFEIRRIKK